MEIKRGNTVIADVHLQSNSFVEEEVMGNHTAQLTFIVRHALELMIGDAITAGGYDYRIRNNEKVEKKETSLGWQYTVTFYSSQYELQDVSFFLHGAPERKKNFDYYNGTATQWLALIVENMNRDGSGWQAGSVIESKYVNMSFKDKSCAAVLTDLCKELDTEYWISGKTISIGRKEYAANGLRFGQGEGMGFKELTLTAVSDTPPVTVLYPYGSDRNLTKEYGQDYLILPEGKLSIGKNVELYGHREQSVQFDDIFPKGEFKVTQKTDNFTLRSADIDFNLTDYLIQDTEAIVTFQDGELAGYDLAIVKGSWDNATKEFRLVSNAEENALDVPGDINFNVGDTFILTNIRMPQRYIDEAEAGLLAKATEHLERICDKQVQLAGKCDDILFKQLGLHVSCGQMVGILSDELKINREIRCTKVKKFLENDREPYRYEITVSDFLRGDGLRDLINEVKNVPDEISKSVNPVKQFTKRTWQDVQETKQMMYDPESQFWQDIVSAIVGEFGHLIVGFQSAQMDFTGVKFQPNYNDNPNDFRNTAGQLVHMTINGDDTSRTWNISASNFSLNNASPYYIYAKCSVSGDSGGIVCSLSPIKVNEVGGYYHFWVGTLNTPEGNVRSWKPVYGYTEIAGQQITTGIIKDRLSRLVIDLINGTIYGKLTLAAGSSGLGNLQEWPQVAGTIGDALTAAESASNAANTAVNTANDKAKVFYNPNAPTSGMRTNDLWVDGIDIRRWNGSSWIFVSKYDATETVINGGLITTGAISFSAGQGMPGTGGMAGTGTIRIWSGGTGGTNGQPPSNPTFSVDASGNVNSGGTITAYGAIKLRDNQAGITGDGTAADSVRIWAGATGSISNALFRVTQDGSMYASKGEIGGFTIDGGNLTWSYPDYFGYTSRVIRMGLATGSGGAIDISFNAATPGAFGIKSVGRAPGGAAIYASSQQTQTYPSSADTWAGYFDGGLYATNGRFENLAVRRTNGSWAGGVSFGTNTDLDKVRIEVVNGLIVNVVSE